MRRTVPRLLILDLFQHSPVRHLTADDVYRELQDRGQGLSMATVYKVLSQFEQAGILQRSDLGQGRLVFELPIEGHEEHGHLVCSNGEVVEFTLPGLRKALQTLAEARGWVLTGYAVTAHAHLSPGHNANASH